MPDSGPGSIQGRMISIYRSYAKETKFYYGLNVGFGIGLNFPINHNSAIGIAAVGTGRAFTPIVETEFNHKYGISYEIGRLRFSMYYQFVSIDASRVNVVIPPPEDYDYTSEERPALILADFVNTDYFDESIRYPTSGEEITIFQPKSQNITLEEEFNKIKQGYFQFSIGISF